MSRGFSPFLSEPFNTGHSLRQYFVAKYWPDFKSYLIPVAETSKLFRLRKKQVWISLRGIYLLVKTQRCLCYVSLFGMGRKFVRNQAHVEFCSYTMYCSQQGTRAKGMLTVSIYHPLPFLNFDFCQLTIIMHICPCNPWSFQPLGGL